MKQKERVIEGEAEKVVGGKKEFENSVAKRR